MDRTAGRLQLTHVMTQLPCEPGIIMHYLSGWFHLQVTPLIVCWWCAGTRDHYSQCDTFSPAECEAHPLQEIQLKSLAGRARRAQGNGHSCRPCPN